MDKERVSFQINEVETRNTLVENNVNNYLQQKSEPEESKKRISENIHDIKQEKIKLEIKEKFYENLVDKVLRIPINELPSQGKIYPVNHKVFYKRYNLQDIDDLNNMDIRVYDRYKLMLQGIHTEGMSSLDLTFHDFQYISVLRRLDAQGATKFVYPYTCVSCNTTSMVNFTLEDMEFSPLKPELPIKARFKSFPEEEFHFIPYSIGDVLNLLENNRYYRTIGMQFIKDKSGNNVIDSTAIFACCCLNKSWEEAYTKLLIASQDIVDRKIINKINELLHHEIAQIPFKCNVILENKKTHTEDTGNVIQKVYDGDINLDTANEDKSLPTWVQFINPTGDVCEAKNFIDVTGVDIIIPFCKTEEFTEYGIFS